MVFICFSLNINDDAYLLASCMFSLGKCLFRYSAHFLTELLDEYLLLILLFAIFMFAIEHYLFDEFLLLSSYLAFSIIELY